MLADCTPENTFPLLPKKKKTKSDLKTSVLRARNGCLFKAELKDYGLYFDLEHLTILEHTSSLFLWVLEHELTVSSERERLRFTKDSRTTLAAIFKRVLRFDAILVLGELFVVVDFPRIVSSTSHHSLLTFHFGLVHLLHHLVLTSGGDSGENVGNSFNQHDDKAAHKSLLESLLHASSDLQDSFCSEPSDDGVPRIVLLSVMNEHAVK